MRVSVVRGEALKVLGVELVQARRHRILIFQRTTLNVLGRLKAGVEVAVRLNLMIVRDVLSSNRLLNCLFETFVYVDWLAALLCETQAGQFGHLDGVDASHLCLGI